MTTLSPGVRASHYASVASMNGDRIISNLTFSPTEEYKVLEGQWDQRSKVSVIFECGHVANIFSDVLCS